MEWMAAVTVALLVFGWMRDKRRLSIKLHDTLVDLLNTKMQLAGKLDENEGLRIALDDARNYRPAAAANH